MLFLFGIFDQIVFHCCFMNKNTTSTSYAIQRILHPRAMQYKAAKNNNEYKEKAMSPWWQIQQSSSIIHQQTLHDFVLGNTRIRFQFYMTNNVQYFWFHKKVLSNKPYNTKLHFKAHFVILMWSNHINISVM